MHVSQPHRHTRLLPALDWAEDLSGGCARVIAVGGRSLRVENHTAVLALSGDCVILGTRHGPLRVEGQGLCLCDVRPGSLVVRGKIRHIDLPCSGKVSTDEA